MTLPEFLLARIAEDELEASAQTLAPWLPASRVLADCDAVRRVVEEHALAEWDVQGRPVCETCVSPDDWNVTEMPADLAYPCRTLRFLTLPYADHENYREEWKP